MERIDADTVRLTDDEMQAYEDYINAIDSGYSYLVALDRVRHDISTEYREWLLKWR